MRILIAPDKFAGTLGAVAAAEAMAAGWRRACPAADIDLAPLSDGGPGFLDVLQTANGGRPVATTVSGPLGDRVPATVLLQEGDAGVVAYIESAQACGLDQVAEARRDATLGTTYGVGELLALAADFGAKRLVVGLGGSATNDGGAGMLAALGAQPASQLRRGGLALREVQEVDLAPARARMGGREIVAATDVDNPLLGPYGASTVFGPQKGANLEQIEQLESALGHWAESADTARAKDEGAGAAGGLGYGLFLLGGHRESGIEAVLRELRLAERVGAADLVVTGEGSFDSQSLRGKVVSGLAHAATDHGVPCLVLAGRVAVRHEEMADAGVSAAYSLIDSAGSAEAAMARTSEELAILAERTAGAWADVR